MNEEIDIISLGRLFQEVEGAEPILIEAPGRINIIGEHTDYNEGYVLPAAIDKSVKIAIQKSYSDRCKLVALDVDEEYLFSINQALKPVDKQWVNFFLGVINELREEDKLLGGFNLIFTSNIPIGAGLSSSAAIECGFGYALNQLFKLHIPPVELALIGQQAEHKFAGVECGIMDQFASMMGKKGKVVRLDCRSLAYEYYPADFHEYQLVLFDTRVKHNLAGTEYNIRRAECEKGLQTAQKVNSTATALRDITLQQLDEVKALMEPVIYNRCKYVIEENDRVLHACKLLKSGDIKGVGKLMFATHDGLSNLYEVSCPELDLLVDLVKNHPAVAGARMMGGGFGGCTINLIKTSEADKVITQVEQEYNSRMKTSIKVYKIGVSDGVKQVSNE